MGKRTPKRKKPSVKRFFENNQNSQDLSGDISLSLSQLQLDATQTTNHEAATTTNASLIQTEFGFDAICNGCRDIYISHMLPASKRIARISQTGSHIGKILNLTSDSPCKLCWVFFELRWSTSATSEYRLYAFSASNVIYGRSARHLRTEFGASPADNVAFAIVPECSESFLRPMMDEQPREKRFLISTKPSTLGVTQAPLDYITVSDLTEDDLIQQSWIGRKCSGKTKSTKTSMNIAIQRARRMGFIYEDRPYFRWDECVATSLLSLLERQSRGENNILCMSEQPVDTGDPDTPQNLGYVPHTIRTQPAPPVQTCSAMDFHGREVSPDAIDYSLLRSWLRNCQKQCDLESFSKDRRRFQNIPFCLVDCNRRHVVPVPKKRHFRYLALSYVWGGVGLGSRHVESSPLTLPERCPAVIEDAITVVLKLGYRYLWVDSLCILPDASLKHDLIANMDLVYKNAELTIVAAAGENAEYGLPGVSSRQRTPQERIQIGSHQYVTTTSEPDRWLNLSTYHTRGWTLQEYFFSRRRLVFSDFQVSFQCRSACSSIHQQESLICPPHHLFKDVKHHGQFEKVDEDLNDAYFRKISSRDGGIVYGTDGVIERRHISEIDKVFTLMAYELLVSEFTKRKLSYEADSMQAVSSILNRFTEEGHAIFHLQGLPFIPRWVTYGEYGIDHDFEIQYGLLWTHGPLTTPTQRRPTFPSWSWAGWEGQVNWLCDTTDTRKYVPADDSSVEFQYNCHFEEEGPCEPCIHSVSDWRASESVDHPRELYFTAKVTEFPLRVQAQTGETSATSVYLHTSDHLTSRVHVTQSSTFLNKDEVKVLGMSLGENLIIGAIYVLLIQPTTPERYDTEKLCYERVGVMVVPKDWEGWRNSVTDIEGCLV